MNNDEKEIYSMTGADRKILGSGLAKAIGAPRKKGEIEEEMESLQTGVSRLLSVTGELRDRLNPVLNPMGQDTGESEAVKKPSRSDLADALSEQTSEIYRAIHLLEDACDRLEL